MLLCMYSINIINKVTFKKNEFSEVFELVKTEILTQIFGDLFLQCQ